MSDNIGIWSDWFPFSILKWDTVPLESGVYEIRWAINGNAQPINRVDGTDEEGLLYIGKASEIKKRLRRFWNYITLEKGKHTAGHTYLIYDYERKIKHNQIETRWRTIPKEDMDDVETKLIDDYLDMYLDSPPLNISIKRF